MFYILLLILCICCYDTITDSLECKPKPRHSAYNTLMQEPVVAEASIKEPKEGQLIRTKHGIKCYCNGVWVLLNEEQEND